MSWPSAWPSKVLSASRGSLVELRGTVNTSTTGNDETIHAALARFLIVRSAGHVEFTFDQCIGSFAIAKSHPAIASYVTSGLYTGRNPWPGTLVGRLSRLSNGWGQELDAFLREEDERRRRELSFLVDRRNKIAHGLSEGIGRRKALDLCDMAVEVADWLVLRLDPRDLP